MLYPLLHRLEEDGLIESEWRREDSGRKRKYYKIKESGIKELSKIKVQWNTVNSAFEKLWGAKLCLT